MQLGQVYLDGAVVAAIFEGGLARSIPEHTMADLIRRAGVEGVSLAELAESLASRHAEKAEALIPLYPAEVWGCGCTYEASAAFRDSEHGTREGFYAHVYREERPEIFFKGTARVCVGPSGSIGLRADSRFTAPEPELAVVLGGGGKILGYTLANDVSAWDIERENPLYLPQSKQYDACCALGPAVITAESIDDVYALEMTCVVRRGDSVRFSGSVSTAKLHRKIEDLVAFLLRSNRVPEASVLLTGTGIIVTEEAALEPGDQVEIMVPEIGTLTNTAVRV